MNMIDRTTLTVSVSGIEVQALRNLSDVCHALAMKLSHRESANLKTYVDVLDDLTRQIVLAAARS